MVGETLQCPSLFFNASKWITNQIFKSRKQIFGSKKGIFLLLKFSLIAQSEFISTLLYFASHWEPIVEWRVGRPATHEEFLARPGINGAYTPSEVFLAYRTRSPPSPPRTEVLARALVLHLCYVFLCPPPSPLSLSLSLSPFPFPFPFPGLSPGFPSPSAHGNNLRELPLFVIKLFPHPLHFFNLTLPSPPF